MADEKIDLGPLQEQGQQTDVGDQVVDMFESALKAPSDTFEEEAKRIASELQKLIPSEAPTRKKDYFFENIWEAMIDVAKHVHHLHEGQVLLLNVVRELHAVESWEDLPCLERVMRDNWIDPTFEPDEDESEDEIYTVSQWLNLNSFAARLFGAGLITFESFAIWQLRHDLEEDLSPGPETDLRVAVASEWLTHAWKAVARQCLIQRGNPHDALKKSYRAGALFAGQPGFGLERWGFWERRLEEVLSVVGKDTAMSVERARECMENAVQNVDK